MILVKLLVKLLLRLCDEPAIGILLLIVESWKFCIMEIIIYIKINTNALILKTKIIIDMLIYPKNYFKIHTKGVLGFWGFGV